MDRTKARSVVVGTAGPRFVTWLDNYTHLNSSQADAAAGGAPRRQPEAGELPPADAVDVGLSQLPPAAVLGAREDRER